MKWEIINPRGDIPLTRDDHTALIYEGSMVIFGGFVDGERTNAMYRYYFKDNKWEKIIVHGRDRPVPRAGHSAVVHNDSMIIFGGRDEENNKLNDLWLFNFSTYFWEHIDLPNAPLGRSGHSASIYKEMMLIFGGIYEVTKELNDMHIYDFRN
jgi:N-acetylneuraminic acid mutarotase